jgi:hypothetical protein
LLATPHDLGPSGAAADIDDHPAASIPSSHPTCPFARHGVDSVAMSACPGYAPQTVSFASIGAGESIGERQTCAYLGMQRGVRGFVTACEHPGGRPAAADEMARRADRAARRTARRLSTS